MVNQKKNQPTNTTYNARSNSQEEISKSVEKTHRKFFFNIIKLLSSTFIYAELNPSVG